MQTFQNFEVIVVDDCSTDSSPAVVESYAPKFGGRLRYFQTNRNTGSGTEPRNLGLAYSRGEYLYFMDNDDAVTPTAFEELHSFAKKYDADVVHCEKFYRVPEEIWYNAEIRKQLKPLGMMGQNFFVQEPWIWENNIEERVNFFGQRKILFNYWIQLVRRDFLIKNAIKMVGIMADDMLFTTCEICCAKKYVLVPNAIYFYRHRNDSLVHKKFDAAKHVHLWLSMLRDGFQYLDKFLSDIELFSQRTDLKYILFNLLTNEMLWHLDELYTQIPPYDLDKLLRKEFDSGDNTALTSFIFSAMNIHRLNLMHASQHIGALENELRRVK